MKEFKYKSVFASVVKCVVDKEKNSFLSTASIEDLNKILPEGMNDEDLLPIASNVCAVNLGNKNGDLITTSRAVQIYKKFINKFIDIEHDRSQVVGHIVNAGFSKFDAGYALGLGSEIISEDQALKTTVQPFNISLAGYIYRIVAPGVVEKILESNDPNSPLYLQMALSWELGFDDFKIMVGTQALADSEIIDDPKKIEELLPFLKSEGGTGKLEDGRYIFRIIGASEDGDAVLPLGVGLTFSPAGAVTGVLAHKKESNATNEKKVIKSENNISHTENSNVTNNIPKTMKILKNLKDLSVLNDENAKEYSFANIDSVVTAGLEGEVAKVAKEWQAKVDAEKNLAAQAKTDLEKAQKEVEASKAKVSELESRLAEVEKAQKEVEATQKFSVRMAGFDELYELDDEDRNSLASDIKDLDDAAFEKFKGNFARYAKNKSKAYIASLAKTEKKEETVPAKQAAASALDKTKAENKEVPATPSSEEPTLKEKYAKAFSAESLKVTAIKR